MVGEELEQHRVRHLAVEDDDTVGVRDKGLLRLEGKQYIVKDGDVLVIRHS